MTVLQVTFVAQKRSVCFRLLTAANEIASARKVMLSDTTNTSFASPLDDIRDFRMTASIVEPMLAVWCP